MNADTKTTNALGDPSITLNMREPHKSFCDPRRLKVFYRGNQIYYDRLELVRGWLRGRDMNPHAVGEIGRQLLATKITVVAWRIIDRAVREDTVWDGERDLDTNITVLSTYREFEASPPKNPFEAFGTTLTVAGEKISELGDAFGRTNRVLHKLEEDIFRSMDVFGKLFRDERLDKKGATSVHRKP